MTGFPGSDALRRLAAEVRATDAAIDETFKCREESAEARQRWRDACEAHRVALRAMYEPLDAVEAVLALGDAVAVDPALMFLEVDPWCFRSGYAKDRIGRLLKRHELTAEQVERLGQVLVNCVEAGDRTEFWRMCKLAAAHQTPRLTDALKKRLTSADPGVARRAAIMLAVLPMPGLNGPEIEYIRELALAASDQLRMPWKWMGLMGRAVWSDDWGAELKRRQTHDRRDPASMLLYAIGSQAPLC